MFIDASAILAILLNEPEADEFFLKLKNAQRPLTSPLARFESALGLARAKQKAVAEASEKITALLIQSQAQTIPITEEVGAIAIIAHQQFGKGQHKARLNMGDCFAYACAKFHSVPLLCKGNDFILTDIKIA